MVHRRISCVSSRCHPGEKPIASGPRRGKKNIGTQKTSQNKKKNMSYTYTFHQGCFFQGFSGSVFSFLCFHPLNSKLHKSYGRTQLTRYFCCDDDVKTTPHRYPDPAWRQVSNWKDSPHNTENDMSVGHGHTVGTVASILFFDGHVWWTWGFVYGILLVKTHGSVNGLMFNRQDLAGCNACLSHLCDICVCNKYMHLYKYTKKYIYTCIYTKTYVYKLCFWGRREWDNVPKHSWRSQLEMRDSGQWNML